MILESTAFADGGGIPRRYTCDAGDVSPPLAWSEPPDGVESYALVVEDPDAPGGTWVHWVVFNLPPSATSLPENASELACLPDTATQGTNGWGRLGYGGPCPPSGTHRYQFRLFALDDTVDLGPDASSADLALAREGHVLAEATLVGLYARS
jgi:Raf kinase inhibitor-like YbhB/YbcL family protein